MNVYSVKAFGTYGGGMAIVAARDDAHAREIAGNIVDNQWQTKYHQPESVTQLPLSYEGDPIVVDHWEYGE